MEEHTYTECRMYDNFIAHEPEYEGHVAEFSEWSSFELRVVMDDGRLVLWNDRLKGSRTYRPGTWSINDESQFRLEFMHRLRNLIYNGGYSVKDISEKSGISKAILYRYINGDAFPTAYNLFKISKALGCKVVDDLFKFAKEFE